MARNPANKGRIVMPYKWDPRPNQMPVWKAMEGGCRRACLVWHRRAGKDSFSMNFAATEAIETPGVYWHMAPTARQVRKIVWNGVDKQGRRMIQQAFPGPIVKRKNDQEMLIELTNGSFWQCVGSDNFDSLVGGNPRGVVFSEWSLANPRAWDFIRPILVENGGWAIFIFTPRGNNHGAALLNMAKQTPGWHWEVLSVEDTGLIEKDVIEGERRELALQYGQDEADAIIAQEWYVDFNAPLVGAYYAKALGDLEKAGRLGLFPHDPTRPVHTAWDLGMKDSTSIWFFQLVEGRVRFIDYTENNHKGLSYYANALLGRKVWDEDNTELPESKQADIEGLEHRQAYVYATHIYPHDAKNSELGTGRRRIDILGQMGLGFANGGRILPRLSVQDGISAVAAMLPRCEFHMPAGVEIGDMNSVERGMHGLRSYRRKWSDELKRFGDTPLHDWASNPADAIRYAAMGMQDDPIEETVLKPVPQFGTEAWMDVMEAPDDDGTDDSYYR